MKESTKETKNRGPKGEVPKSQNGPLKIKKPPKGSKPKKTLRDYVSQSKRKKITKKKAESAVLIDSSLRQIDADIVRYLEIKKQAEALAKEKKILEGRLDSLALDAPKQALLGVNYHYTISSTTYDKVISKADAIKAGVWEEIVSKGWVSTASRKSRTVGKNDE